MARPPKPNSYDQVADLRLKRLGNRLLDVTKRLTGKSGMDAHGDAVAIMTRANGFEPSGSGPNRVSDARVRAAIPRVNGMLALARAFRRFERRR